MSRLETMARFNEEIPEANIAGYCDCCNGELYKGQGVVVFDVETFCDTDCFLEYMGVTTVII